MSGITAHRVITIQGCYIVLLLCTGTLLGTPWYYHPGLSHGLATMYWDFAGYTMVVPSRAAVTYSCYYVQGLCWVHQGITIQGCYMVLLLYTGTLLGTPWYYH